MFLLCLLDRQFQNFYLIPDNEYELSCDLKYFIGVAVFRKLK